VPQRITLLSSVVNSNKIVLIKDGGGSLESTLQKVLEPDERGSHLSEASPNCAEWPPTARQQGAGWMTIQGKINPILVRRSSHFRKGARVRTRTGIVVVILEIFINGSI